MRSNGALVAIATLAAFAGAFVGRDRDAGGHECLLAQTGTQQEDAAKRTLMTGQSAEEAADQPAERLVPRRYGYLLETARELDDGEPDHHDPDDELQRLDVKRVPAALVFAEPG